MRGEIIESTRTLQQTANAALLGVAGIVIAVQELSHPLLFITGVFLSTLIVLTSISGTARWLAPTARVRTFLEVLTFGIVDAIAELDRVGRARN